MGNKQTAEEKKEKSILKQPKRGEANEFYWACRNGDLTRVRQLADQIPDEHLNKLEPNGSTALHAATFNGHADVVRFLLHEKNVQRHRRNRFGLTAYEECPNENIRKLFYRPEDNQRFYSTDPQRNELKISDSTHDDDDDDDNEIPNDWVAGTENDENISFELFVRQFAAAAMASKGRRFFVKLLIRLCTKVDFYELSKHGLQQFIDTHMTENDQSYNEVRQLISKYSKEKNIEHLLSLYTIECPFYKNLGYGDETYLLLVPLIWNLHKIRSRSFIGTSYRGMAIDSKSLSAYQWAIKDENRRITTQSFWSTSIEKQVAEVFIKKAIAESNNVDLIPVLVEMIFPVQCETAIRLYPESKTERLLSKYENEKEILLFPGTKFTVTQIRKEDQTTIITMKNLCVQWDPEDLLKILGQETLLNDMQNYVSQLTEE